MSAINPYRVTNRNPAKKEAAVIFAHGFTGGGVSTWDGFEPLLETDEQLGGHDFFFWTYPTELKLRYAITKYFWEDDPNIETIGKGLRTLLNTYANDYERIILVGHSMGGLVIQGFILEELVNRARTHLDRITEVILYGTPSGGLKKAGWGGFLKNQIADMDDLGPFIQKLRNGWTQLVDDQRSDPKRLAQFRLTLVAGMKDQFVPQESSLDPFPFDEHELAPGNHVEVVKPVVVGDFPFRILKKRLLRPGLTAVERALINGESEEAIREVRRVQAAAELADVDGLLDMATKRSGSQSPMPIADKVLGLALLDNEQYRQAADLLTQYVEFQMPDSGSRPFASDAQAIQQLAIALSGAGDIAGAVTRLKQLDPQVQDDPETQGILAGRFKRQWLKSRSATTLGWKVYDLYNRAYQSAKQAGDSDQAYYNGINAAYMSFALGGDEHKGLANEVLQICGELAKPGYWSEATRAEAHLLLGQYAEADKAYDSATRHDHQARHRSTTGQQALDIVRRQDNPPDSAVIVKRFRDIKPDYPAASNSDS
ncbi:MAG TPA: tetratricopeptide repeat-containing protein [Blastocatellia bacterium]|nr:tetratricopeptide repeat-containing protein [Blastocatellia bacterium]